MAVTLESLLQPGRVAYLLSEIQINVVGDAAPFPALTEAAAKVGLIPNSIRIAKAAREHGAPVIHCTIESLPNRFGANRNARLFGSARKRADEGVKAGVDKPVPGTWADGDLLLPRYSGLSSFNTSPLDSLLRNEGITTLVLSGVSLSFGILSTTFDAVNRGYQVIIPRDTVAAFPEAYAEQVLTHTLPMLATITTTDDLLAAWPRAS